MSPGANAKDPGGVAGFYGLRPARGGGLQGWPEPRGGPGYLGFHAAGGCWGWGARGWRVPPEGALYGWGRRHPLRTVP